jgi:hypothetical protein
MTYALWIPALILHTMFTMWASVRISEHHSIGALVAVQVLCLFSLWGGVSYFSRNLLLDGFVFDIVLFLSSAFFIALFSGRLSTIGWLHYLAISFMVLGISMFKIAEMRS